MATCQTIITGAYRRLKVIDETESPTAAHAVVGLEALQDLFNHQFATAALEDYVATAAYTAEENQRIRLSGGSWTITYPTTITGEDRDPEDLAVVVVAGASPTNKFYDAQLAAWVDCTTLTLAGECPLSKRNRNALTGFLAEQLAGEYGREMDKLGPALRRDASHGKQLLSRIGGERPLVTPSYF